MMRYLVFIFVIILFVFTTISYFKVSKTVNELEFMKLHAQEIQTMSDDFLNSLLNSRIEHFDSIFNISSNEALSFYDINKPALIYFFSPNDCISCIDDNIFTMINLSQKYNSINVYIISTKEKMSYLISLSRTHKTGSLNFAYLLDKPIPPSSNYFLLFEDGSLSNTYFPIQSRFASSQQYLLKAFYVNTDQ